MLPQDLVASSLMLCVQDRQNKLVVLSNASSVNVRSIILNSRVKQYSLVVILLIHNKPYAAHQKGKESEVTQKAHYYNFTAGYGKGGLISYPGDSWYVKKEM